MARVNTASHVYSDAGNTNFICNRESLCEDVTLLTDRWPCRAKEKSRLVLRRPRTNRFISAFLGYFKQAATSMIYTEDCDGRGLRRLNKIRLIGDCNTYRPSCYTYTAAIERLHCTGFSWTQSDESEDVLPIDLSNTLHASPSPSHLASLLKDLEVVSSQFLTLLEPSLIHSPGNQNPSLDASRIVFTFCNPPCMITHLWHEAVF
jgi:hypothetical protein